jgi:hypothetical protein
MRTLFVNTLEENYYEPGTRPARREVRSRGLSASTRSAIKSAEFICFMTAMLLDSWKMFCFKTQTKSPR